MINSELIKFLGNKDQERLRTLEAFFASPGWQIFFENAAEQYDMAKNMVLGAGSWPENRIAVGRMSAYGEILQLEAKTQQQFETMALDAKALSEQEAVDDELDYE